MSRLVLDLRDARPIWSITDWALAEIRGAVPDRFDVVEVASPADSRGDGGAPSEESLEAVANAEVYMGFGFPRPLFLAAQQTGDELRWVHSASAGVGGSLYREMRESEVILTNSAGIHAEPMADSVLGAILYFARGLDLAVRAQQKKVWDNDAFSALDSPVHEIAGSTLGIVGFGGIGAAVGRRALSLGMRVLAFNRSGRVELKGAEVATGEAGLRRLLDESRYLVLSLPRTSSTEGFLNRERIRALSRECVIVNVGRGELIDEEALVEALTSGNLRGAALDVFHREPLPPHSPFWELPNVLVTPHSSATTHQFWRREVDLIIENLRRYEAGEPMLNQVDKAAGY